MTVFEKTDIKGLIQVVDKVNSLLHEYPVILLEGELGAGKTTFVQHLCTALGVVDEVSSPTFGLVNEYTYPGGVIYHFDCYRLKGEEELLDIGFVDYLDSDAIIIIEWPEIALPFVEKPYLRIRIRPDREGLRDIFINPTEWKE